MSETYTKLFSSILRSTIWSEDNDTRLVWITMLALADRDGYVGASLPGLAHEARVSLEATEAALAMFLAPDEYSRSQEHEGRRIEVSDRGWTLLNYDRFRDMRDEEARKEYERNRKREQRARDRVPDSPAIVPDVPQSPALSAQAEAAAAAEAEAGRIGKTPRVKPRGLSKHSGFDAILAAYDRAYKHAHARAPVITAADRSQIGKLLRSPPSDVEPSTWAPTLVRAVADYVADADPWLEKQMHALRLFPSVVNRYLDPADVVRRADEPAAVSRTGGAP